MHLQKPTLPKNGLDLTQQNQQNQIIIQIIMVYQITTGGTTD